MCRRSRRRGEVGQRRFRGSGAQQLCVGLFRRPDRFGVHLFQSRLPLHIAHFVFDLHAEIGCNAPEIRHRLPHYPGNLRQLLRPQNNQSNEKDDYEMGDAEHICLRYAPNRSLSASNG